MLFSPLPTNMIDKNNIEIFGTGAVEAKIDKKDYVYDGIAAASEPFDWNKGYDIEKEIGVKIPIKNQNGSLSCVGQAWSYYAAILNTIETGKYTEISAKAIYSLIFLPEGGSYIREGGKLLVEWGALYEQLIPSYENNNPPTEKFIRDKSWKNENFDNLAKCLKSKEYRIILGITMEAIAQAIRDNYGVVGGVNGCNNGTWSTLEPKPGNKEWGHALYFGKAGIDEKGKYIATPNSWGDRFNGQWQKLREEWFVENFMFNPWLLIDQPNIMSQEIQNLIQSTDKGMIIENEAPGRKGIIYGGKLKEIINGREGDAALYLLETKGNIKRVTKDIFNQLPKGSNF